MAENSGIEWTHHTFNPWTGCTKLSPACDFCYAEGWAKRSGHVEWGPHGDRRRTKTWGNPVKWNRQAEAEGVRYRVFCASLADVFDNHKSIQDQWRTDLWRLIATTPHLDWLLLTKRPQNVKKMVPWRWGDWPDNVWIGSTVEDQKTANQRIWHLAQIPARVRFLSCEPLIGPLDLTCVQHVYPESLNALTGELTDDAHASTSWVLQIDWVITGGESGAKYRPADPDWFRSLRDQCAAAKVPFLFKQWEGANQKIIKAKGRELDGVIHDGYPVAA
ncbi:MAG: phage Gp37/Gp68 family protein [Pseudomonadota bacterium]